MTAMNDSPYDDELNNFLTARGWLSDRNIKDQAYIDRWHWPEPKSANNRVLTSISHFGSHFHIEFSHAWPGTPITTTHPDAHALRTHIRSIEEFGTE